MSNSGPAPSTSRVSESLKQQPEKHKVAVIIPARNEARRISHTVRACRALPGVDLLIVVDDGSLIDAVQRGICDCAIATLPKQKGAGGHGFVVGRARKSIRRATGWHANAPLSGQRCITRKAVNDIMPFAPGWGVEVAMTIDLLVKGYTVQEIPCDFTHRATANDLMGYMHRADQFKDVWKATTLRRIHRHRIPVRERVQAAIRQTAGSPYNAYEKFVDDEQE